ncbi:MAG: hypothetical protein IKO41_09845 [Lachnospiraceae bacterium]|nr:hypothetical protein [Lachnospiraceae bacterium]
MNYQDFYGDKKLDNKTGNVWYGLFSDAGVLGTDAGVYRILMNVAVFAAGIALLAAVLLLAISASGGASSKTFQEAKRWIIRIIVISVLIFGVTGLVTLVGVMGMD